MEAVKENTATDFHWSIPELFLSFLLGVGTVAGLWLFSGLIIMLFLM
jgi:hypothetical protein